jgi:hypothetical protein
MRALLCDMRPVDPTKSVAKAQSSAPKPEFKRLIKASPLKTGVPVKPLVPNRPAQAVAVRNAAASTLQTARASSHAEAKRLGDVRMDGVQKSEQRVHARSTTVSQQHEQLDERAVQLIGAELKNSFENDPPSKVPAPATVVSQTPATSQAPGKTPEVPPSVKGEQAVALIEKIEIFVKSQRPTLSITLNNSLGARVEIEKVGPSAVSLKLIGHKTPPGPEVLARIQSEMKTRGLKIAQMTVA